MWRKGNPRALLVGMQTGAATVENSMEGPQKIKNRTALWPRDSTLGNTSEEPIQKHICTHVHGSVIYNSQNLEAAQVSIIRWVG